MTSTTTPRTTRLAWIDRYRGLAVLLMVLDHTLNLVDPWSPIRFTVTRLSFPLFVGCAAIVFKGTLSDRRVRQLAAAVVLETILGPVLDLGVPGPVALIASCCVLATWEPFRRYSAVIGALGLIQAIYVPLRWHAYEPGLVLCWWALAPLALPTVAHLGDRLPSWLAAIGRRPLFWYSAHLVGLSLLVTL